MRGSHERSIRAARLHDGVDLVVQEVPGLRHAERVMRLTAYRLAAWLLAGMLATLCSCTAAFAHSPPPPEGGIAAEGTCFVQVMGPVPAALRR